MARDESSREDLLREATALVERIELALDSRAEDPHIVAGFRRDGALSIFFGEDAVYQFNAAGELRRAHSAGKLFKALRGKLVTLDRVRAAHEVQLVSHELTGAEEAEFLSTMHERMRAFAASLSANKLKIIGQVPQESNVLGRLESWLDAHREWSLAARPNV